MNIGQTIQQCRKIRGLTQANLAERSGVSVSHLCLIEKAKREPSFGSLQSIANALDIPMSILVFLAAENYEVYDLNAEHVDALKRNITDLVANAKLERANS